MLHSKEPRNRSQRKYVYTLPFLLFSFVVFSCSRDNKNNQIANSTSLQLQNRPNIVVILTDQERYPANWPTGWAEKNLLATERLKRNGLTFTHAYTAACECAPSRAVLTSSEHYPINHVSTTPPLIGLPSFEKLMDIGALLTNHAGYEVVWKGKWHLSPPIKGGHDWQKDDIANVQNKYGISGWNPPDAGTAITESITNPNGTIFNGLTTLGGGYANNDGRFVHGMSTNDLKQTPGYGQSAIEYIKSIAAKSPEQREPFCLFVSLVNPHDVWVYPNNYEAAGYKKEDFTQLEIELPSNYEDSLTTKPSVQLKARNAFNKESPFKNLDEEKEYVKFYAYLTKLVDSHVASILDALDEAGLTDNTIIIRTADHGELGLSHGMREKSYTVYEENIHIPLIVSNPRLFPAPQVTDCYYCHLDLMPTLAQLAGIPNYNQYGKGKSIAKVLQNPKASVQDSILFTFDDTFFLPKDVPGGHIRAIREGDWTYAVYYSEDGSHFEYEMYNLKDDPGQLHNLLFTNITQSHAQEADRLHKKLKEKMLQSAALPRGFAWPEPFFNSNHKFKD